MGIDICNHGNHFQWKKDREQLMLPDSSILKLHSLLSCGQVTCRCIMWLASKFKLLYVPGTFARKYLSGDECAVVQDSDESKLAVALKLNCGECFLTGWTELFKASNVKEIILFFEMIKTETHSSDISVFYA